LNFRLLDQVDRRGLLNSNIGEYRLIDYIGAGGMGEVYRAVHSKIGRVAAVKIMTRAGRDPRSMERFLNEARIQASLQHPNIATLYDFCEVAGQPCIIMEFVDGQTLDDRITASGRLPASEALFILQAVAEALSYMHSHGIVHRDIKANNIKITSQGGIKLLDFGIAKDNSTPAFTQAGDVIGTLQYLSPELLKGGAADARSDIWALGVLLYEMTAGQTPFEASTIGQLYEKISKASFVQATVINPSLPREIDGVITRCLKRNPSDRYQSIPDLLAETTRLASVISTPRLSTTTREKGVGGFSTSRLALISAGAAILIIMLIVVIFSLIGGADDPSPAANRNSIAMMSDSDQKRAVTIEVAEGHADVYRGGEKLGMTPFRLEGKPGEELQLVLKAEGYADKTVKLSVGQQDRPYTFTLERK
jgi:serine/threonine protein kinase